MFLLINNGRDFGCAEKICYREATPVQSKK